MIDTGKKSYEHVRHIAGTIQVKALLERLFVIESFCEKGGCQVDQYHQIYVRILYRVLLRLR